MLSVVLSLAAIFLYCCIFQFAVSFFSLFSPQSNVTFSCGESVSVAMTFIGPQSFLQLPGRTATSPQGLSVGFQFRTWNKAGLLLTFNLPQQGGAVWLYLSEAKLHLQIHKTGKVISTGQFELYHFIYSTP